VGAAALRIGGRGVKLDPYALRKDFPALERTFSGKPIVYLDNSCVTLRPRAVIEAVGDYYANYPGCHGRTYHKFGLETTEKFNQARERVGKFIGAGSAEEIIFLRNTTEGINLLANILPLAEGETVLTSELEHNSNYLPWQALASRKGIVHKKFLLAEDLSFDFGEFEKRLTAEVRLVSVAHKSHVTGCINPVRQIAKLAHAHGALVILDAAQSAGCVRADISELGVDFMVFSAHKMLGPSGFGALYAKKTVMEKLPMFLTGGNAVTDASEDEFTPAALPDRFEAGLQDYAGAAGLAAAMDYLERIGLERAAEHVGSLNAFLTEAVAGIKGLEILGPRAAARRTGILNFVVKGVDSMALASLLDKTENIMVRAGAHCAHPWFNKNGIPSSLRVSFHLYNTVEEAELFAKTLRLLLRTFY